MPFPGPGALSLPGSDLFACAPRDANESAREKFPLATLTACEKTFDPKQYLCDNWSAVIAFPPRFSKPLAEVCSFSNGFLMVRRHGWRGPRASTSSWCGLEISLTLAEGD